MKTPRQHAVEDALTVSRRSTQAQQPLLMVFDITQVPLMGLGGIMVLFALMLGFEKFRVVNRAEDMALWADSTLVNYRVNQVFFLSFGYITEDSEYFELWVLIDAERHEWSKHVCVLPPLWKSIVPDADLDFVGMNRSVYEG